MINPMIRPTMPAYSGLLRSDLIFSILSAPTGKSDQRVSKVYSTMFDASIVEQKTKRCNTNGQRNLPGICWCCKVYADSAAAGTSSTRKVS